MKLRLWAIGELLKRYRFSENKVKSDITDLIDCLAIIMSVDAAWYQKKAARMVLDWNWGKEKVDELIEDIAVVTDRNDRLVRRWRRRIIERDKVCKSCGNSKNLHVHHISHWSDDPINRVNVNNGITLCKECHTKEHPELNSFILSNKSSRR